MDSKFEIKVSKRILLERLHNNRNMHVSIYAEACKEYKKFCLCTLRERSEDIEEGLLTAIKEFLSFDYNHPVSYEDEYNEAIGMLEMSLDEEITITNEQYQKWVKDNWEWKYRWKSNTLPYSKCGK